jgi:hypothetical protein
MKAVTGVFEVRKDAERALLQMRSLGITDDQITLLTPDRMERNSPGIPSVSAEQPGMGKAIGAVMGAAAGLSGGALIAIIPGVGPVAAIGLLGGAVLAAAGGGVGAVVGGKLENSMTEGLPEDEIFVYEDALRKGRSVIVALAKDEPEAARLRELLSVEGAESVDAAREQWWVGLRSAEREHYSVPDKDFDVDEQFYRLGFESALHARTRCKEYDQVMGEMNARLEELKQQHPGANVEEPFVKGYERGRDYYQQLCNQAKAA